MQRRRVLALLVLLVPAWCACTSQARGAPGRPPAQRVVTPVAASPPEYRPVAPVLDLGAPTRVTIPAIGVDSALVPLGLGADGSLEVPADFGTAGWYTGGPRPGESGPAVIAGHVDSTDGPAVFYRLRELSPGDAVLVTRDDGSVSRFTVDRTQQFAKSSFPSDAVFGPTQLPELRLVTCGGAFDARRRSYVENLVVFASAASP